MSRGVTGPVLVVEASRLYEVLADDVGSERVRERLAHDEDYIAPHVGTVGCRQPRSNA